MDLHSVVINTQHCPNPSDNIVTKIQRVPGGWIYNDKTFVPEPEQPIIEYQDIRTAKLFTIQDLRNTAIETFRHNERCYSKKELDEILQTVTGFLISDIS